VETSKAVTSFVNSVNPDGTDRFWTGLTGTMRIGYLNSFKTAAEDDKSEISVMLHFN
jgi:hypothetical protein